MVLLSHFDTHTAPSWTNGEVHTAPALPFLLLTSLIENQMVNTLTKKGETQAACRCGPHLAKRWHCCPLLALAICMCTHIFGSPVPKQIWSTSGTELAHICKTSYGPRVPKDLILTCQTEMGSEGQIWAPSLFLQVA